MNPVWRSKPDDAKKVREAYMNSLKLQISNNAQNEQQVNSLRTTGVARPNALPDNRTADQKRADLERVKVELRSEFLEITTGIIANDIVQEMTPSELIFTSNQIRSIMRDLKDKFALKHAPAPVVLGYIRKSMRKFEETKGVEYGLQQDTFKGIMSTPKEILELMPTKEYLESLKPLLKQNLTPTQYMTIVKEIKRVEEMILPTWVPDAISKLPPSDQADIIEKLNRAMEDFPQLSEYQELAEVLEAENISLMSKEQQRQIYADILELVAIPQFVEEELYDVHNFMERTAKQQEELGEGEIGEAGEEQIRTPSAAIPAPQRFEAPERSEFPVEGEPEKEPREKKPPIDFEKYKTLKITDQRKIANQVVRELGQSIEANGSFVSSTKLQNPKTHLPDDGYALEDSNISELIQNYNDSLAQAGGRGEGLKKTHRMKGKGLVTGVSRSQPKEKQDPYKPFGKYIIHTPKLNDNIIQIRSSRKGVVPQLPSTAVSKNLAKVVKTISGGGFPSFDELSTLTEPDKKHLKMIVKKSQLSDKISVPSPDLTKDEQEQHRFEILKGEILAGSDSKELIREFKQLLMKFVYDERVPKREAHEILMSLAIAGL